MTPSAVWLLLLVARRSALAERGATCTFLRNLWRGPRAGHIRACWFERDVCRLAGAVAITLMPVAMLLVITMAVAAHAFSWPWWHRVFIAARVHRARRRPSWWRAWASSGCMARRCRRAFPVAVGTLVAFCVPVAAAINWTVVQHAQRTARRSIWFLRSSWRGNVFARATLPWAPPFQASARSVRPCWLLGLGAAGHPCVLVVCAAGVCSKAPGSRCWACWK